MIYLLSSLQQYVTCGGSQAWNVCQKYCAVGKPKNAVCNEASRVCFCGNKLFGLYSVSKNECVTNCPIDELISLEGDACQVVNALESNQIIRDGRIVCSIDFGPTHTGTCRPNMQSCGTQMILLILGAGCVCLETLQVISADGSYCSASCAAGSVLSLDGSRCIPEAQVPFGAVLDATKQQFVCATGYVIEMHFRYCIPWEKCTELGGKLNALNACDCDNDLGYYATESENRCVRSFSAWAISEVVINSVTLLRAFVSCPSNTLLYHQNKSCIFVNTKHECVSDDYVMDFPAGICVCRTGLLIFSATGECISSTKCNDMKGTNDGKRCYCPRGQVFNSSKCVLECASNFVRSLKGDTCVQTGQCGEHTAEVAGLCTCASGYALTLDKKECVTEDELSNSNAVLNFNKNETRCQVGTASSIPRTSCISQDFCAVLALKSDRCTVSNYCGYGTNIVTITRSIPVNTSFWRCLCKNDSQNIAADGSGCFARCSDTQAVSLARDSCISSALCGEGTVVNPLDGQNFCQCAAGKLKSYSLTSCSAAQSCIGEYAADLDNEKCVGSADCGLNTRVVESAGGNICACELHYPQVKAYFAGCSNVCSNGMFVSSSGESCVAQCTLLASNGTSCVTACEKDQAINLRGTQCTTNCGSHAIIDSLSTPTCKCESGYPGILTDFSGCSKSCSAGYALSLNELECVPQSQCGAGAAAVGSPSFCRCSASTPILNQGKTACIDYCELPLQFLALNKQQCITDCSTQGLHVVENAFKKQCVCEAFFPQIYEDFSGCTDDCSDGRFISLNGLACVSQCDVASNLTHCIAGCQKGFVSNPPGALCVKSNKKLVLGLAVGVPAGFLVLCGVVATFLIKKHVKFYDIDPNFRIPTHSDNRESQQFTSSMSTKQSHSNRSASVVAPHMVAHFWEEAHKNDNSDAEASFDTVGFRKAFCLDIARELAVQEGEGIAGGVAAVESAGSVELDKKL